MAKPFGQVVLDRDDLRQFNRAIRNAADTGLPKRMGQANKKVGAKFISEWLYPSSTPAAVGKGAGAAVRPSASKREVLLRVGGKHRVHDSIPKPTTSKDRYAYAYWGKRAGPLAFQRRPKRPHIRGSVDRHEREIRDFWLEAVAEAMAPAFHDT